MKTGSNRSNDVIGEVGVGVSNTKDNGRASRKPSESYSLNRKMSAECPISMRELNRIKGYHTVNIDTDFIVNFNHDFMNDNVI